MQQISSERDAAVSEVATCKVSSSGSHHITPIDATKQALSSVEMCSSPDPLEFRPSRQ